MNQIIVSHMKHILQISQLLSILLIAYLLPLWTSIWELRAVASLYVLKHCGHWNGRSVEWLRMCSSSLSSYKILRYIEIEIVFILFHQKELDTLESLLVKCLPWESLFHIEGKAGHAFQLPSVPIISTW